MTLLDIRCDAEAWTARGELWGVRLLSREFRRPLAESDDVLALDTYEVTESAHVPTNIESIHGLAYLQPGRSRQAADQGVRSAVGR